MLVFVEGGKPKNLPWRKTLEARTRTNNKLNPHNYDIESGNRTWATLVGGKCSHHWAIPAPPQSIGKGGGAFSSGFPDEEELVSLQSTPQQDKYFDTAVYLWENLGQDMKRNKPVTVVSERNFIISYLFGEVRIINRKFQICLSKLVYLFQL